MKTYLIRINEELWEKLMLLKIKEKKPMGKMMLKMCDEYIKKNKK